MIKNNTRYCDRCGTEIPTTKASTDNSLDMIILGFKTTSGRSTLRTLDICTDCMDSFDDWLTDTSES